MSNRLGGIFLIICWLIIFSLGAYLINNALYSSDAPVIEYIPDGTKITIDRDYDSHFRLSGSINNVPVTFMLDTGATTVAIPDHIAEQAGLKRNAQVSANTAAGTTVGYLTRIKDLTIANLNMHNIAAIIIPDMQGDQVLLGMNVLRNFTIQQTADTMVLTIHK